MNDIKNGLLELLTELILPFIMFIIIAIIVFAPIVALVYFSNSYECNQYGETTGKETKYKYSGCYIKDGDNWYIWDEYKNRLVAKGEMP